MKKYFTLVTLLACLTFSTASIVATYHGTLEKKGPEAEYKVGYASDNPAEIRFKLPDKEGLNISYERNHTFSPGESSRTLQRQGKDLSVKEFFIQVSSEDPVRGEYTVPVTLTAYPDAENGGGTRSEVIQEREYSFTYVSESSDRFDEDLLNPRNDEQVSNDTVNEEDESSGPDNLSQDNDRESDEEEKSEGGINKTTLALAVSVLAVFSYTFYEVVT
jgi:hypothetical protein